MYCSKDITYGGSDVWGTQQCGLCKNSPNAAQRRQRFIECTMREQRATRKWFGARLIGQSEGVWEHMEIPFFMVTVPGYKQAPCLFLFERESARGSRRARRVEDGIQSELCADSRDPDVGPRRCDLSRSQTLNQLSHSAAPTLF